MNIDKLIKCRFLGAGYLRSVWSDAASDMQLLSLSFTRKRRTGEERKKIIKMASHDGPGESMDYENQGETKDLSQTEMEKVLLTLSLKWLDKNKKKTDLEKSLLSRFSKFKTEIDCRVQEVLPDGRAVILVSPPPGLTELQKLSGETLYTKDKKFEKKLEKELATILSVMVGKAKQDPQTADDASVNPTPPAASVNTKTAVSEPPADKAHVEDQKKPVSTPRDSPAENQTMDESCVLSLNQFLYVSHIFKEKLQRIQNENEVEIKPEVTVKFESKRKDGKPNEAKTKFTDIVQKCLADINGSVFTLSSADPDQLNRAFKVIMNKENKLFAAVSSEEMTVFGPSVQRKALDSMLKPKRFLKLIFTLWHLIDVLFCTLFVMCVVVLVEHFGAVMRL